MAPKHECDQIGTLADHEDRLDQVERSLNDGRVTFAEIRKDLAVVQATVTAINAKLDSRGSIGAKIVDALVFWAVPAVGTGAVLTMGPGILAALAGRGHP